MPTFKFYTDAGLTTELTGNIVVSQQAGGSDPPVDTVIYLGSTTASKQLRALSDPGVDQIVVDIVDAVPASGHPDTDLKLALTAAGLDGATPGASLNLGTTILSGVGNAVAIYIRFDDSTSTEGTSTELSLDINDCREDDV